MHRRKQHARVWRLAANVFRSVEPVDSDRVNRPRRVIFGMQKLHNPANVVRLPRWFTDEVDMVWLDASVKVGIKCMKQMCEIRMDLPLTAKAVPSSAISVLFLGRPLQLSKLIMLDSAYPVAAPRDFLRRLLDADECAVLLCA